MKILAVGDSYCPSTILRPAFAPLAPSHDVTFVDIANDLTFAPETRSERSLAEYFGTPRHVIAHLANHDVLVVHGAPITDEVLGASPNLRLVCCMRGGPVNVDLAAATARGVAVATTPGKNANAVAELTVAFMIMLARRIPDAMRHVDAGGPFGRDNFEGAAWFGWELAGRTLGLIGFGRVGSRVAHIAAALGMRVIVHDPYVEPNVVREGGAVPVSFEQALETADVVSMHARATAETRHMLDQAAVARMKPGSLLINTARDILLDEDAVYEGLRSGRLGGAAFDVLSPQDPGRRHRFLALPNVVIVPHIGGSTTETLRNGCRMVVAEIERFVRGEPLMSVANGAGLAAPRST